MASTYGSAQTTQPASATDAGDRPAQPAPASLRRANRKRTVSVDRFAALAQATGQMVAILQRDGSVADAPSWRAFTGQTAEQARGWGWLDALHPDDRQRAEQFWRAAVAAQQPFTVGFRARRDDGVYCSFAVRVAPTRSPDGSVREWVSAATDISERRALEEMPLLDERAAPGEHKSSVLEHSADGFIDIDKHYALTYVNARVEQMLGKRREELVGCDVRDVFPEALATPFYRELERALAEGASTMAEVFYPPLGLWFEARLFPVPGGVIAYLNDSRARNELRERLAESLAREQAAHDETERNEIDTTSVETEITPYYLLLLHEVTDIALSHLTLSDLVPALLNRIGAVLAVESAAILLMTEDGQALAVHTGYGALGDLHTPIPLGRGIAGRIAATRQSLIVDDLATVEVLSPVLREQLRSVAGVPLLIEGRRIGVLLIGAAAARQFTGPVVRLLQLIGDRIALAIDHGQLYELARAGYAEAEARASVLAATFATMTDGVFVTDQRGGRVQTNQAFRQLLGLDMRADATEIPSHLRSALVDVRDALAQPVPPERMPTMRILRGEVLQGPTAQDLTLHALDGRIVEANVTGAPVRTTDGGIVGAVAVYRDVTKRRQLERQVAEQASQLEGAFGAMADAVVVFEASGRILRDNAADRAMFGFDTAGAMPPRTLHERGQWLKLRDERGRPLPRKQWPAYRVLRGEDLRGSEAVELKARTMDGRELELSESGAPIRDKAGRVIGGVLVVRDVTERRKLEHRTKEALQSLLGMAEALVDPGRAAGATTTANLVINRLAELTRSLLGCRRVNFMAFDQAMERITPIVRVGSPEDEAPCGDRHTEGFGLHDYIPDALIERLREGEVVPHEVAITRSHGRPEPAVHRVLFAPLRISSHLIGLLGLDYGEQARQFTLDERALAGAVAQLASVVIERERLVSEREAAHAGEFASREATQQMKRFTAMAGHEFRTPLAIINQYLFAGKRALNSGLSGGAHEAAPAQAIQTAQMFMDKIDQAAKRVSHLLDDLLQVSRAQTGKLLVRPQPCDLIGIVSAVVEEQRQMNPTRQVRLLLPAKQRAIALADAERIRQVVTNYLTNACKYSPREQPVDVRVQLSHGAARVSIRDWGAGLTAADKKAIWDCYYQSPNVERQAGSEEGLGLGLYVCRMIIEQHHGLIGVKSSVGKGSTFWFTLPLSASRA